MNAKEDGTKPLITLKDLYPELDDNQLIEAEDTLEQYLEVVLRIYNRLRLEKEEGEPPALTHPDREPTMIPKLSEAQ